jgi:hypothetical protein
MAVWFAVPAPNVAASVISPRSMAIAIARRTSGLSKGSRAWFRAK